jgi:uncharacterized phage protein gp47/JayE
MAVNLQTFTQWVQQQAAAVQASATQALDLAVGSVLRAILEANASVALWMQWLVLQALAMTRAATSSGTDLDTWMADFSLVRQPAVAASGVVTFAALSGTPVATIAPGVTVRTSDGSQVFAVTALVTHAAWNVAAQAYIGSLPLTLPVLAASAGVQGNVLAGTVSLIAAALVGVDTVVNSAAFTSGVDAETDGALRSRFANYINTRSQATKTAIGYAVQAIAQNLTWTVQESVGSFIVTVDDGTGSPSSATLAAVGLAVEAVRPVGITYAVNGPSLVSAAITFTVVGSQGYSIAALRIGAVAAVTAFVNALPLGSPLPFTRLPQVIYDSSPGISNVLTVMVNSASADLGGGPAQVVRIASVVAS